MIKKITAPALLLITPLIFAPITLNFFTTNKLLFIIIVTLILLTTTAIQHLTTKKHLHRPTFFTLTLAIFWLAIAVNLLVVNEAKTENLILKGALLLALPIIAYLLSTAKKSAQNLSLALTGLVTTGTILSLHGILQLSILTKIAITPAWMQNIGFTPAGSPLILITIIIFTFITTLTWSIQEKNLTKKTSLFTAAGVQLAALIAYGFIISRGEIVIQLLPLKAGWSLTLDALKNAHELIFGVGLANFPVLFTQFRPIFLTQTNFWTTVFRSSSNEALQLLATTGILGFSTFILLIISIIKNSLRLEKSVLNLTLRLTIYAIIFSFFLVPANIITYTFFFTLAGLMAAQRKDDVKKEINLPSYSSIISTAALAVIIISSSYFTYRAYAAEFYMRRAQQAFVEKNAQGVYGGHIKALQLIPTMTDYHISLSQVNLNLAASLSQAQNPELAQVDKPTDQQRKQISTLIQQAIEHGKAATQLRPSFYTTWQNLSNIYRNLINVAEGSENFAVQYLSQAIAKDPVNPLLRFEYGGLLYQLSQLVQDEETSLNLLDQSIQQFQTATQLRPSYANAHYNLANAFDKKSSYRLAYQAMTQALASLELDSPDYQKAQNELLELEKKLPQAPEQQPAEITPQQLEKSQLQQPAPLPSPLPGGLVELSTDTESTASASPTPKPAP